MKQRLVILLACCMLATLCITNNFPHRIFAQNGYSSPNGHAPFQLSVWVDLGLENSSRGYWSDYHNIPNEDPVLDAETIRKAKQVIRKEYHTNQIYLIYHRQYELEKTKQMFLRWKEAQVQDIYAPYIIPTLVLQNYENNGCNFTDQELQELVTFFKENINSEAIAIYEIYSTRTQPVRNFCAQEHKIQEWIGPQAELHRVGLQPSEPLPPVFDRAVQDTYTGIAFGRTNEMWKTACGFEGEPTAEKGLQKWVRERVGSKTAYDLIVVAMDYSLNNGCGLDNLIPGDEPTPTGRNQLAFDAIVSQYPNGLSNPNWTGISIDLKIIHAHSQGKDPQGEFFYQKLKRGEKYSGYFHQPLDEAVAIFDLYDGDELPPQDPAQHDADLNNDGVVNILDYNILVGEFGKTNDCSNPALITPGDCDVSLEDLNLLLQANFTL